MPKPRKPTHLKIVSGTYQPCRINKHEPMLPVVASDPPDWLGAEARRAWADVSKIASDMRILTVADAASLETLAQAIADMRMARASLARPLTVENDDGKVTVLAQPYERYYWTNGAGGPMRRPRPELADISDADRRILSWVSRFGMTPADRSRVSAGPQEEVNAFADLG